jgi:hypothetical protein
MHVCGRVLLPSRLMSRMSIEPPIVPPSSESGAFSLARLAKTRSNRFLRRMAYDMDWPRRGTGLFFSNPLHTASKNDFTCHDHQHDGEWGESSDMAVGPSLDWAGQDFGRNERQGRRLQRLTGAWSSGTTTEGGLDLASRKNLLRHPGPAHTLLDPSRSNKAASGPQAEYFRT